MIYAQWLEIKKAATPLVSPQLRKGTERSDPRHATPGSSTLLEGAARAGLPLGDQRTGSDRHECILHGRSRRTGQADVTHHPIDVVGRLHHVHDTSNDFAHQGRILDHHKPFTEELAPGVVHLLVVAVAAIKREEVEDFPALGGPSNETFHRLVF